MNAQNYKKKVVGPVLEMSLRSEYLSTPSSVKTLRIKVVW